MRLHNRKRIIGLLAIPAICGIGMLSATPVHADTIDWATWSNTFTAGDPGSATATMTSSPITASYSGEVISVMANYPSWTPTSSYVGGTIDNAPPQSGGIVQMQGGDATPTVNTITFSAPVLNPVMAIWSLGQTGIDAEFDFTSSFNVEAGGPSAEYQGNPITADGDTVFGVEGNGTIQFQGLVSSITWTNPVKEFWYGFTVGVVAPADAPTVPVPSSLPMSGLGMAGLLAYQAVKSIKRNRLQAQPV